MKIKIYITFILVLLVGVISFSFRTKHISCKPESISYPSGAAQNIGAGYSGASWDNGGLTCSDCHGGGAYNPTTTISLLSGTTAVTQYTPGNSYTLKVTITSASGTPKYAFDIMAATTTAHTNINKWGTMPTGTRNNTVSARNYVEQTSARAATSTAPSTYILSLPWTAPVSGTGSVTFYAEGMAVNGTGGTSGDSPAPAVNLSIPEASTAPVTISSFTAVGVNQNTTLLQWKTEQEINTAFFEIQRSVDGNLWESIGKVNATGNSSTSLNYSFNDNSSLLFGTTVVYYRVKAVDLNGNEKYTAINTVSLNKNEATVISKSAMPIAVGAMSIYEIVVNTPQDVVISTYDITGKILHQSIQKLYAGTNSIQLQTPANKGIYPVKFATKSFVKTLNQIVQ